MLFFIHKIDKVRRLGCPFRALWSLGLALILMFNTSCSSESETITTSQAGQPLTYFTSGDPLQIIEGAELDRESPFRIENLELFNNFGTLDLYRFVQNRAMGPTRPAQDDQKPPEKVTAVKKVRTHQFEKKTDTHYVYSNGSPEFDLDFTVVGDRLEWTGIYGQEIEPLHYSTSVEGDAFSLLGLYDDPSEGRVLVRIVFMRPAQTSTASRVFLEKVDDIFNYLFGPNVIAKWRGETKTILLCGPTASEYKTQVQASVDEWGLALENRLELKLETPAVYPPFSDLRSSCIYSVNQYIMDPRDNYVYFGLSVFSAYLPEARLLDSDIFIFEQEFAKLAPSPSSGFLKGQRQRTLTHEIGHLLGLHHIFDGTESVMSYDRSHSKVESYDVKAIQGLYPLKTPQ